MLRRIAARRAELLAQAELRAPAQLSSSRQLSQLQPEGQSAPQEADPGLRLSLQWLAKRYVVHRAQADHQERMHAYGVSLSHLYMAVLLLLLEDLPFFTIGTTQLLRSVQDQNNEMIIEEHRMCSKGYSVSFTIILLNTLKSAGMLAIKLHRLQGLPLLFKQKEKLRKAKLRLQGLAGELDLALVDEIPGRADLDSRAGSSIWLKGSRGARAGYCLPFAGIHTIGIDTDSDSDGEIAVS